jgi:fermentation-respiration switch protein FrsA (DUF1100 family)
VSLLFSARKTPQFKTNPSAGPFVIHNREQMDSNITNSKASRARRRRGFAFIAFLITVLVTGTAVFGLRRIERAIAFHPERYDSNQPWTTPINAIDVWFRNNDGDRLHGWFSQSAVGPAKATIIYFHGNGDNVRNLGWLGEQFAKRGFDILVFDYRGYGRSEGSLADEQGLYADADAAYEYLVNERRVSPQSIVLYGQSLGTAAAANLAARRECAAVVMESGMTCASDMATVALPWLPRQLHFLARNRFDSIHKITQVHCPVLISHGEPDDTIPTEQGRALFAAANEPKELIVVPGAGHNVFGNGGEKYLDEIAKFLGEVANKRQK